MKVNTRKKTQDLENEVTGIGGGPKNAFKGT